MTQAVLSPGLTLDGQQRIAGISSRQGDRLFRAINAATGQPMEPNFGEATLQEVDQALEQATQAHRALKRLPRERRAELLEAIADRIEALGAPLLERAHLETALPLARLTGERGRTCAQLRLFAQHVREGSWLGVKIETAQPDRSPLPKPDLRTINRAIGPVAIFGASNFPLAFSVAGGDTASALAAGCPVIVKAHPSHPGTSELVAQAIDRAIVDLDLPPGMFSLLHSQSHEVGAALVTHPQTKAVGFTGSLAGGKALFDLANSRPEPIPVFAEMGSVNPVFLLPDALASRTQELTAGLASAITLGVGQFCTNPGLLITVAGEDSTRFAQKLAEELDRTQPGIPLHSGIQKLYEAGMERLLQHSAELLTTPRSERPRTLNPTLLRTEASTVLEHPKLLQEVFGPCSLLVECSNFEELLILAERLEGQLTATLQATEADLETCSYLLSVLEEKAGRLLFNSYPTGVEVCHAMCHGGPYPATTQSSSTSVGTSAIDRFTRPVCYQNAPASQLPIELQDENPDGILRRIDGEWRQDAVC